MTVFPNSDPGPLFTSTAGSLLVFFFLRQVCISDRPLFFNSQWSLSIIGHI